METLPRNTLRRPANAGRRSVTSTSEWLLVGGELESTSQITDSRAIGRDIGIASLLGGIRQVVAATG